VDNIQRNKHSMLDILVGLIDPMLTIPLNVKTRVLQEEHYRINRVAFFSYLIWPSMYIILYFALDQNKVPIEIFRKYRFGLAGTIWLLGLLAYIFRRRTNVVKFSLYLVSLAIPLFVAWSMTFGYPVQTKWLVFMPTLVLISVARSFILPVMWVLFITMITKPIWVTVNPARWLVTDTIVGIVIILFGHIFRRIWLESKVNQFINDDLIAASIEQQLEFDKNIKSFISPVLVSRIEEKTRSGESLVAALDSVLMRRANKVSVLFNDVRNFSTRSIDSHFVENELIPASSLIIDRTEANGGVAKQIGDAVFVYYSLDDPEEALLRAMKDGVVGCIEEKKRIEFLGRNNPERFFSLSYGNALVGNMASTKHREATVIGAPANLAARMDGLTKKPEFNILVADGTKIIMSEEAVNTAKTFHDKLDFQKIDLVEKDFIMKSFPDEKSVYLFATTPENIKALNEVLIENKLAPIEC
jgi:class 3 adenylate cyclase